MDGVGQRTYMFGLNFRGCLELFAQKGILENPSLHGPADFMAGPPHRYF